MTADREALKRLLIPDRALTWGHVCIGNRLENGRWFSLYVGGLDCGYITRS